MESVFVGLVVNPVSFAVRGLVLEATGDLKSLVVGALVRDHSRLLLLVAIALLVAVVIAVDTNVVVLLLLRNRDARILAWLLLLRRRRACSYQYREKEHLLYIQMECVLPCFITSCSIEF